MRTSVCVNNQPGGLTPLMHRTMTDHCPERFKSRDRDFAYGNVGKPAADVFAVMVSLIRI